MKQNPVIAIVAGEESGDKLGAGLMQQLLKRYPLAQFVGIGGDAMIKQGLESVYPMERLSVMGIGAILKRLPELLKVRKKLIKSWTEVTRPDCFIGIDAPEFNTGLELALKQSSIKTIHYVSPSVWAWRPGRIKKISRAVDHMLTLFPFENEIYQQHQVDVTCVGHPMAVEIDEDYDKPALIKQFGLDAEKKTIALLPGSRGSELQFLAPLFIQVASELLADNPQLQFICPLANDKCADIFTTILERFPDLSITLVNKQSREVMMVADVVLLASGTATLEAALLKKPMVVSYKVSPFSYMVFSSLSVLSHYALPNLLAAEPFVEELLQDDASADKVKTAVLKLLYATPDQQKYLHDIYQELHQSLKLGGSEKAAQTVIQVLQQAANQANEQTIT